MRGPKRSKVRVERRLRRAATDAEMKLWFALRDRRLNAFKFVRQEAIGSYVAKDASSSKSTEDSTRIMQGTAREMRHSRQRVITFCDSGIPTYWATRMVF